MKKVAIIYSGSRDGGGVDTYLSNLFSHNKLTDITLFSLGDWQLVQNLGSKKEKVRIFSSLRFNPITVIKMAKILKGEKYNLVVTGGVVSSAYGRAAAFCAGIPVLTIVHSDQGMDYQNPMIRMVYGMVEALTRWETKHYIAVSEYLKSLLINNGVDRSKISTVYNGVRISSKQVNRKQEFHKKILIGSIGRLHPVKNYTELIKAISQLKNDKLILRIAGEGTERKKIEKLINTLKVGNQVELLGHVDNIENFLLSLDIYVQPSLSEGFGLTVVEAMLAGLPVIVAPGGALTELIKDGETGIIAKGFDSNDLIEAIKRYVNNPNLTKECAQNGREYATKNFTIKKWVDKTEAIFLKLAK